MEGRSGVHEQAKLKLARAVAVAVIIIVVPSIALQDTHRCQPPDQGQPCSQPGIQCTQLKDLECILCDTRAPCRSESYLDLGRACFLQGRKGGVCLPEKGVTFLHFVRLGRFVQRGLILGPFHVLDNGGGGDGGLCGICH